MGFFDDFGKKISSAGQEAIAKTKELADVAKINSSICDSIGKGCMLKVESFFQCYGNNREN